MSCYISCAWVSPSYVEPNLQPFASQANDKVRPIGHSEWWWDVFKNLIESCHINYSNNWNYEIDFNGLMYRHITWYKIIIMLLCFYLRYFAFAFRRFSPLFALFRIWLSRQFAFIGVITHFSFALFRLYLRFYAFHSRYYAFGVINFSGVTLIGFRSFHFVSFLYVFFFLFVSFSFVSFFFSLFCFVFPFRFFDFFSLNFSLFSFRFFFLFVSFRFFFVSQLTGTPKLHYQLAVKALVENNGNRGPSMRTF